MLKKQSHKKALTRKKGQSTLEYILLVGVIVGILIVILGPGGPFEFQFNKAYVQTINEMPEMSNRLANSRPAAP